MFYLQPCGAADTEPLAAAGFRHDGGLRPPAANAAGPGCETASVMLSSEKEREKIC